MTRTVIVIKICRWTGFVTRKQWLWRLLHGRGMSLMSHEKPKIINMFMSSVLSLEHVVFPVFFSIQMSALGQQTVKKQCMACVLVQSRPGHTVESVYLVCSHIKRQRKRDWERMRLNMRTAHHSFFGLPLAIEIPDTCSTFHCKECSKNIIATVSWVKFALCASERVEN